MGEVFDDYDNIRQVLDEKRWDYADAALFSPTDGCFVSGFFTTETDETTVLAKIDALKSENWADFSGLKISVEIIDSVEWENEWKKYYKPFNIGNIVIVPEWIEYKPTCGDIPVNLIRIGVRHRHARNNFHVYRPYATHPITRKRVLDFGCGSGILGVCATALGSESVLFADTDEQAIAATRYNCQINGIDNPPYFYAT